MARLEYQGSRYAVETRFVTTEDGRTLERAVVVHPPAVTIVPRLADGRLVLIRNHRIAVDRTLWEFPAGMIDPGEEPQVAAGRELREETGYRAGQLDLLGTFYTSPGFTDEYMYTYLATSLTAGSQALEVDEHIQVEVLSAAEVGKLVVSGELVDGKTLAALQLLRGHDGGLA